jgi:hypothetical protein
MWCFCGQVVVECVAKLVPGMDSLRGLKVRHGFRIYFSEFVAMAGFCDGSSRCKDLNFVFEIDLLESVSIWRLLKGGCVRATAKAKAKYRDLSTARRTMKLSVASVEMTFVS